MKSKKGTVGGMIHFEASDWHGVGLAEQRRMPVWHYSAIACVVMRMVVHILTYVVSSRSQSLRLSTLKLFSAKMHIA